MTTVEWATLVLCHLKNRAEMLQSIPVITVHYEILGSLLTTYVRVVNFNILFYFCILYNNTD